MSHCDIRDTVSSGRSMLPGTVDGMTHVCYFRHALALDERRVKFLPEYAYGASAKLLKPIGKTRCTWAVIQLLSALTPSRYRVSGDTSPNEGGLVCRDARRYVGILSFTSRSLMYDL